MTAALVWALVAPAGAAERRNVVLMIADDMGLTAGCYGDKAARTPNIDQLAADGTLFRFAFATVASCSPSRSVLYTGLHTHTSGQYGLAHASHNAYTRTNVRGLPALLKAAGYYTGVIGKLHVQPQSVYLFDDDSQMVNPRNVAAVADRAKQFLAKAGDKPFCLILGYTDPHRAAKGFANDGKYPDVPAVRYDPKNLPVPYHLPDTPDVRADLAEYYQSVSRLDHGVGLIRKLLRDSGRDTDTLVIFLSDNGIPFPGAKTTLYDSGLQLPLIIHAPGRKGGVVTSAMASWVDVTPTILDWAGVKALPVMAGRSLLPILNQESPAGWDEVYGSHQFHEITMYYPMRMIRTRTHKLILNIAHPLRFPFAADIHGSPSWQGILKRGDTMMGQRSVQQFLQRPREELYDLRNDPNELKNVAGDPKQTEVLESLRKKLRTWQQRTNDPWIVKYEYE
jgi:N-sulfoglucosamine sulfohydrolase